jgi:Homeodomain-like domain
MPARRELTMRQLRQMLRLHHDGVSAREIGRTLGVARSTIQDNLERARKAGIAWPLAIELGDEVLEQRLFARGGINPGRRRRREPDWTALARELKRPGVNLMVLWEEYRQVHPDGYGYSRFCDLYREFERRLSPVMRQHHVAGDKVFVDYSGKKIAIVNPATGEVRDAEIFVAVLGASNYSYAEATWTQALPDWIEAHVRMFRFFGGVPRLVVPDYVPGNIIGFMCRTPLCGPADGVSRVFEGGPRACGHIMSYSEPSHSSRVLSSFQATRVGDAAEIPEPTSQVRSASAFARSVSSA